MSNRLTIDLQDGFEEDTVVVNLGNREVARRENVTTNRLLGLADSLEIEVPEGPLRLTVAVPSREIEETLAIDPTAGTFVTLSLRENTIEMYQSDDLPGYA